jgi:signal transduction histidine kinase
LNILTWLEKPEIVPPEIRLGNGSAIHYYNLKFTPLKDQRNRIIGHLLSLNDISEQRQAQAKIMEQQKVVAMLEERERLAREFHDGIAQTLGYASMQAQIVRKLIRDGNLDRVGSILDHLIEATQEAHADIRESILNLKAGSAQEWFLFPTLERYLSHFQEFYGIHAELSIPDTLGEDTFEPVAKIQLLRVVQEVLTNARKHSNAHNIYIVFQQVNNSARITITDDGVGFDPSQLKLEEGRHFGLRFMHERMEQIGGSLIIDSRLGAGTAVKLEIPLRNQ